MKKTFDKLTRTALFLALALILSIIENMFPISIPIPGVKIGLANIAVIAAMRFVGYCPALAVSILRPIFMLLLFGNPASFVISLGGALFAYTALILLIRLRDRVFSYVGISSACAFSHIVGQILCASLVTKSTSVLLYLPLPLVFGTLTGVLTGVLCEVLFKRLEKAQSENPSRKR